MKNHALRAILITAWSWSTVALADWDPSSGQWGKTDVTDVRVMTYNIRDHICRNTAKSEEYHGWHALARIVAAMRPDVLIMQEAGDNTGNGTPGGLDTVAELTTTLELFIHGGTDPYQPGGPVGAYVQKYAPDYDLPYIFVSTLDDGYNRNVLLSRFPFVDLNGDTISQRPDISWVFADEYAPGGNGGIRGFMFAEIDLPDDPYAGDLVVGNAHLKSGSNSSDLAERLLAAKNVAYYIDYLFNGAGTGTPDPHGKIYDIPPATTILDPGTPVIIGGDWNEDEWTNGRKGPAEWLANAALTGGADGTDRDRTDATFDYSAEPYTQTHTTMRSGSAKYDYQLWQDSIAGLRNSFIFNSTVLVSVPAWQPPELLGFTYGPQYASAAASDHLPVIADYVLPLAPAWQAGDMNCSGAVGFDDINPFVKYVSGCSAWQASYPDCPPEIGDVNGNGLHACNGYPFDDVNAFVALLAGG